MSLLCKQTRRANTQWGILIAAITGLLVVICATAEGHQFKLTLLHIGSTPVGPVSGDKQKEEGALASLKSFIKEETGFNNDIVKVKDWRELVDKMARKEIQLGVFQGYEFAWATEKTGDLVPLAVAVNVYVYPVAYVVVKKTSPIKDFAGLRSKSIGVPNSEQTFLKLYVDKACHDQGQKPEDFFSKITNPTNIEDALDDVVDGMLEAVVADRTGLEAFKRRKPGRFAQLKEIAQSPAFPPPLVAYYKGALDNQTLLNFQDGLLKAHTKEKGQTMLTLFKLTRFEKAPADLDKILVQTRKTFPQAQLNAK